MKYFGSCLCGDIKFEIKGEFENFFLCHCPSCRKDTGSAFAANLFSSTAKLKWLKGEELVKSFRYQDTRHVKSFCPHCSSALPNIQQEGNILVVPAGSLDSDIGMNPVGHIYYSRRGNWENDLENLPHYDNLPEEKVSN